MIISVAKANQAAEILGVELATLDTAGLKAAWRTISKTLHPDAAREAFSQEAWAKADWAHTVLKGWLDNHPAAAPAENVLTKGDCLACGGSGRIAVGKPKGFGAKPVTVQCVMCAGSGTVTEGQRGFYGRSE